MKLQLEEGRRKTLCDLNSHSLFNSDDNVNYASRWQRCQKKWRRYASRLSSRLHLEWQAAKTGRQADSEAGSSRAMRQLQMELLDRMSQRMDNAADAECSKVVEGGVGSHNMPPWKCIKFPPLRNKHERTRECLTILMSIKRLIYMHHHQQQRKVPISAPLSPSLLIYLKSHSTL